MTFRGSFGFWTTLAILRHFTMSRYNCYVRGSRSSQVNFDGRYTPPRIFSFGITELMMSAK